MASRRHTTLLDAPSYFDKRTTVIGNAEQQINIHISQLQQTLYVPRPVISTQYTQNHPITQTLTLISSTKPHFKSSTPAHYPVINTQCTIHNTQ
jgi:hypothetical protein